MALTRKSLKAMGLTDEQVDSIVEMHTETVDGLKDKLKTAEEKAERLDGVEKELNELKAKGEDDYKSKYEQERKEFEAFKKDVTAKETKAAKEKAIRAYLEGKRVTGDNQEIAMMAVSGLIDSFELDGDSIKDTAELDDLFNGNGKLRKLIVTQTKQGAVTAAPPTNTGGSKMTKAEIFAKDERGNYKIPTEERQKAIAENLEIFNRR